MAGQSEERDRMKQLLVQSISTLCRSGLHYSESMRVEGLLAITLDEQDIIVVNVNKTYEMPPKTGKSALPAEESLDEESHAGEMPDDSNMNSRMSSHLNRETVFKVENKRRGSEDSSMSPVAKRSCSSSHDVNPGEAVKPSIDDSSRDSNFSGTGSLHSPHSGQEKTKTCSVTKESLYISKNSIHSMEEPPIKIEIESDSDTDCKEGVMEDLDLIFDGKSELVEVSQASGPVPVSLFGDNIQSLPGTSAMYVSSTTASGTPCSQPAGSAQFIGNQSAPSFDFKNNSGEETQLVQRVRGIVLIYKGYTHRRDKQWGDKQHWRCSYPKCKGRIHSTIKSGKMEQSHNLPEVGELAEGIHLVQKGRGVFLIFNGYAHRRDRLIKNKQHWRCVSRHCKGRVHSVVCSGRVQVIFFKKHHHLPHVSFQNVSSQKPPDSAT